MVLDFLKTRRFVVAVDEVQQAINGNRSIDPADARELCTVTREVGQYFDATLTPLLAPLDAVMAAARFSEREDAPMLTAELEDAADQVAVLVARRIVEKLFGEVSLERTLKASIARTPADHLAEVHDLLGVRPMREGA
jgi:hypothetical protein